MVRYWLPSTAPIRGGDGIRTRERLSTFPAYQAGALNHSATP